jgi:hypothetical protein
LSSCQKEKTSRPIHFYHWKAQMNVDQQQMDALDSLNVQKLYLRFFDVKNGPKGPEPISILNWKYFDLGRSLELIPVVFITNNSFKAIEYDAGVDSLAEHIAKKLEQMIQKLDTVRFKVNELQIDCDWSLNTQSKYFRFLQLLKKKMPRIESISATIRLHQVKYFTKTGVPPVDKGVLMFYNMGKVQDWEEDNSILNLKTAKKYLQNFKSYPLRLDVALPLFSWGVQFRNGEIVQLINDASEAELEASEHFEKIGQGRYKVLKSTYLNGLYVYKNDELRIERVEVEDLKQSMKMLKKAMKNKDFELIFYHLDDYILKKFSAQTLNSLEIAN